jgi:hypothetical protein
MTCASKSWATRTGTHSCFFSAVLACVTFCESILCVMGSAFKRMSVSGNWKTNVGSSQIEEIPMTPAYKRWADEAATMLGGLDILTVDGMFAPALTHRPLHLSSVSNSRSLLSFCDLAIHNKLDGHPSFCSTLSTFN